MSGDRSMAHKLMEAVMHRSRVTRSNTVTVTGSLCREFGVDDRQAKRRALRFWQSLGVWELRSQRGKNPTIQFAIRPGKLVARGHLLNAKVVQTTPELGALFADGTAARIVTTATKRALESARRQNRPIAATLEDYGIGWVVTAVDVPSTDEPSPLVIESLVCSKT